jgi:hypothetical protein
VALTARQRNRLPDSAFAYPNVRKFPVPTKAQARKAGISERQRLGLHRNALARAAQRQTMGSHAHVARKVDKRSPVTPTKPAPGKRRRQRRRR